MRSSKNRSRSKSNRNRSVGNIVNRVFDSSGPEGKVRGTPQQIIEKYNQLARDAQLSNDRVAAENFQQHAEHYTRMLAEAQREAEARREQQQNEQRDRQQRNREERDDQPRQDAAPAEVQPTASPADVMDVAGDGDSGLVETPEASGAAPEAKEDAAPKARKPRNRRPKPAPEAGDGPETPDEGSEQPEAAE